VIGPLLAREREHIARGRIALCLRERTRELDGDHRLIGRCSCGEPKLVGGGRGIIAVERELAGEVVRVRVCR
jgi:hypothetical protein